MKKLLLALALLLAPSTAWAQCSGAFPNNTVCGNITGTTNIPRSTAIGNIVTSTYGIKQPVDVATTTNITLFGEQTIDGVLTSTSRVLVKNQSVPTQNGIYISGSGAWVRSGDLNAAGQAVQGTEVRVTGGTINGGMVYFITTANPITPGITALTFSSTLTAFDLVAPSTLAPTAPSAGQVVLWSDVIDKRFHDKNDAGVIGTTVVADTGAAHNFLTGISTAGVISKAQPSCADLSDGGAGCSGIATNDIAPVAVATTANITLSGEQTIDGITTSTSRVLVKDQSNPVQNGTYITSSGAWVRTADSTPSGVIVTGSTVFVVGGSTQAGRLYTVTTSGAITVGTTPLTFQPVFGAEGGRNVYIPSTDLSTVGCTLEDCVPSFPVFGYGSVFSPAAAGYGGTYAGLFPQIYLRSSAIYFVPGAPSSEDWLKNNTPTEGRHGNTIIGAGAPSYDSFPTVSRTTILGALNQTLINTSDRCEALGQGSMRYAKYCERSTAVGTATMEWLGQDLSSDPGGKYYWNAVYYNSGTPVTDPSWDLFSLETKNPGIRATIAAWNSWATDTSDVEQNVAVGRDSLDVLLKGTGNSAYGYRSSSLLLNGSLNTSVGVNSLFGNLYGTGNTAVGNSSGFNNQTGSFNTYEGYNAGYGLIGGDANVMIGSNAGFNTGSDPSTLWTGNRNVCIGNSACRGYTGTVNDRFILNNTTGGNPLMWGEFVAPSPRLAIGVADESPLATLHVKVGDSGASPVSASGIFVENSGDAHVTIGTGSSNTGSLNFADSGGARRGYIDYSHASDIMSFAVAAAESYRILSTGAIVKGYNSSVAAIGTTEPAIQINGDAVNGASQGIYRWDNGAGGPTSYWLKSRSGTIGTQGIVTSGTALATLSFGGSDGSAFIEGARIQALVDGTPGTNDMPGRLQFSTTADGAAAITVRYTIDSAGHVLYGGTVPTLSSCGTSPSISGNDVEGTVTLGTGLPTGCTITFATAYSAAPRCNVTWRSNLALMQYTTSTTALTLTQTGTSSDVVDYFCRRSS
jgi:hypothetical protein